MFYKLLGSGKNGTFDIQPDLQQWAVLVVTNAPDADTIQPEQLYGKFITGWWRKCNCEVFTVLLQPIEGHGLWDGKECFGTLPSQTDYEGTIAVLTRATIRMNKIKAFWKNVPGVAALMHKADGFLWSAGIGEVPWIKQATISVWQSKAHMKQYAYKMQQHAEVIKKTRTEKWYSEELFVRFKIIKSEGTLQGIRPF